MNPISRNAPTRGKVQKRFLANSQARVDQDTRTVQLSFSSEAPCERYFGEEVLSHAPGAADLGRLNSGAPLLFNHNPDDVLGVVVSASIGSDMKGRAVVRFGKDDRGEWAMSQVADGILSNVSLAYSVEEYQVSTDPTDGEVIYTAPRWSAIEISIVTVPADISVGVGRSHQSTQGINVEPTQETQLSRRQRAAQANGEAVETERERIQGIRALARTYNLGDVEDRLIAEGTSVQEARGIALGRSLARGQSPVASAAAGSTGFVGLTDGEARNFSIVRAVNAIVSGDWTQAGFERECSQAVQQQLGRPPAARAFFVPMEVQQRTPWSGGAQSRAAYQAGTPSQGGNLVSTDLLADQFIEALRNSSQVLQAGATVLSGLVGNIDIPRRITATATSWVAESGALSESEATFDKVSLRPKTVGAYSKLSRNMMLQSTPAIEQVTRADLMLQIALAIDLAALSGSGASNQPLGVANTSGIGAVIGGTNGIAVTMDNIIALEAQLSGSNAPWGSRKYILNAKTIAALKQQKATTGAYIWTDASNGGRSGTPPDINGYSLAMSNQARSSLTKGSASGICSELFFGAWSELLVGQWGVLEIVVNPYDSTGFLAGDVLIRAMQTMDIAVRHSASFAVMSDALTS